MDKREFKSEQSNFSERLNHFIFKLELAHAKFNETHVPQCTCDKNGMDGQRPVATSGMKKIKMIKKNEKTWSALYEYKIIIIN